MLWERDCHSSVTQSCNKCNLAIQLHGLQTLFDGVRTPWSISCDQTYMLALSS